MKKLIATTLALALTAASLAGCSGTSDAGSQNAVDADKMSQTQTAKAPKYVFLFIGDGMSYPQIQSTSDYLGALKDEDYWQAEPSLDDNQGAKLDGPEYLNFMNFESVGSAVTYDSNSFCPDSASTATSISTGHKTYSGTINMDETGTTAYETIAEQLKDQKNWEIGIISSVNLNHATPAAFYAHQASRNNYYEIGQELIASDFDYFAGGGLVLHLFTGEVFQHFTLLQPFVVLLYLPADDRFNQFLHTGRRSGEIDRHLFDAAFPFSYLLDLDICFHTYFYFSI